MNVVFVSPHFPAVQWQFCDRLRRNGVNVLGIGDAPYDMLETPLKNALNEYYRVGSLENYDEVYRAVAFFTFKYGRIDWIESNNEYWLEQDARLRTDFNISTGVQLSEVANFKNKSAMKRFYRAAGVPVARLAKVEGYEETKAFLREVGYPVIVKPDNGVGALGTWKIENDAQFDYFYATKPRANYVTEEFIDGDIFSYDAITDSHCHPLFENMTVWPPSIAEIVTKQLDLAYYTAPSMPDALRKLGRASVRAFNAKSRFVHLEFFRLRSAKPGLGEAGDFVGLEVNMRPPGGHTPDMMNWGHSTDVFQIWADMVTMDGRCLPDRHEDHSCVYAGRRDIHTYVHSNEEILDRWGPQIAMVGRNPQLMWPQMGQQFYIAHTRDEAESEEFIRFVQSKR